MTLKKKRYKTRNYMQTTPVTNHRQRRGGQVGRGRGREKEKERKRSTSEAAEKQGLQRQTDCRKGKSINIDPNAVTTGIAESAGA